MKNIIVSEELIELFHQVIAELLNKAGVMSHVLVTDRNFHFYHESDFSGPWCIAPGIRMVEEFVTPRSRTLLRHQDVHHDFYVGFETSITEVSDLDSEVREEVICNKTYFSADESGLTESLAWFCRPLV